MRKEGKNKSKSQKTKVHELGFGNKAYRRDTRLIRKDGGFNVTKDGLSFWESLDTYHELIAMSWGRFFLLITGFFFIINLLFAIIYFTAGPDGIQGTGSLSGIDYFVQCVYFSTQTITTVGFGKLNPNSNLVSIVSAFESFIGLLGFALATGLMFSRFSRPNNSLIYSDKVLVSPYGDINAIMFRFANSGNNQLIEAEVDLVASMWDDAGGRRVFEPLNLELKKINFFSTSWTVVHPLEEDSPLYGISLEDMKAQELEIIAMFKAFDDTYARQVYDRTSYTCREIEFGKRFLPVYSDMDDGTIHIDLHKIGEYEDTFLN